MNQFFQDNLVTIIVFLLLLIFVMMGGMIFILFKLLVQKKSGLPPEKAEVPVSTPTVAKFKLGEEPILEKHYCSHHPDQPSVASCLICEDVFCEECLVDHESMHFCKEHFRTFAGYKWKQITDERTTPDTPEDGLYIYKFKRDLWLNTNIPTFVMTHYKINIENDYIESFIQLNVREDDVEKLSKELEVFRQRK